MTNSDDYRDLEPQELWRHFAALNRIPRPSGQEAAAREYVQRVAETAGMKWAVDARGNTVVYVPATVKDGASPVVAVQAHLDMVCEKRPDTQHDFFADPIRQRRDGDRIFASGTTLGADNGIGAAAALALITDSSLDHGPLELIFTVEEETGLHGAMALDPSLVNARLLINLDSEDPDELTVGCAGGAGTILRLPVAREATPLRWVGHEIVISGLKGGHSGVQIHEPLANGIKLLMEAIVSLRDADHEFRLVSLMGGSAHNAIPRDAIAHVGVAPDAVEVVTATLNTVRDELRAQWKSDEPDFALDVREAPLPDQVMTQQTRDALLGVLRDLPHGVLAMSEVFPDKVETSSNLAGVKTQGDTAEIATSSRSFIEEQLQRVQDRIQKVGETAGAEVEVRDGYPGWEPDPHSRLLQIAEEVYRQVYGKPPQVEVVHAGLECGVIVSKLPGMEAISFGPLIRGAHTPEEHVYASTVSSTWKLLTHLLSALAR